MIIFVRHGQTDFNLKKIKTGHIDIPLNNNGVVQAKQTALELKNINFDACFCSPLLRAKQTCDEILKYHTNVLPNCDNRLIERTYGKLDGTVLEKNELHKTRWQAGKDDKYKTELGGETTLECYNRVKSFLDEVCKKYKGKNVLVVTHGGIIKVAYAYFNLDDIMQSDLSNIKTKNAGIFKFEN